MGLPDETETRNGKIDMCESDRISLGKHRFNLEPGENVMRTCFTVPGHWYSIVSKMIVQIYISNYGLKDDCSNTSRIVLCHVLKLTLSIWGTMGDVSNMKFFNISTVCIILILDYESSECSLSISKLLFYTVR